MNDNTQVSDCSVAPTPAPPDFVPPPGDRVDSMGNAITPFLSDHPLRVALFMHHAGQKVPRKPTVPDEATRLLRAKLILEEAFELIEKGLGINIKLGPYSTPGPSKPTAIHFDNLSLECVRSVDMVELADGIADVCVVNTGTALACGMDFGRILNLVDQSNLAKFGPGGHRREDGKWVKPPDWQAPDLLAELANQGYCELVESNDPPTIQEIATA